MELTVIHKKLIQRLSDGQYYSGKQLALELGISRTSVWNSLKKLEDLGIELHAVKGKGTRLAEPLELLDKRQVLDGVSLDISGILSRLDVLDCTPSTNAYLVQQSRLRKIDNGTVCLAEMQTAGKGRLGRAWVSPFAQNVYISFVWNFKTGVGALSGLSLACGAAVCKALQKMGLSEHKLKWPNDILFEGKKLAGILVEIQGESQDEYTAVIGIGVNCHMTSPLTKKIDQPWVDLKAAMPNHPVSRNELAAELINQVLPVLSAYESQGLKPSLKYWDDYDGCKNKKIRIISGKNFSTGIAKGITEFGELKLLNDAGDIELISSGEVSLRLE
ncbi:MAG: bifunctional biotin--[acetyl-CoA-carboxylase] synthetase/biotin operon repressor [Piscirickettsiaceae bacterium]|nr:MAG: bifunctional biotin--[acetyl-CoA-carboxylase] synthetase/biotin operon repressor [Piscirickettsiaceae bacterium]PCI69522.1 MAG: bifunctional biotin--[acetyl-CoA-carboxylase] synthetase/biotin operon repressor [Piscirickettsiaceae bacterium]